jgi:hypothetical protein
MFTPRPPQATSDTAQTALRLLHGDVCSVRSVLESHHGACATVEVECERCHCILRVRMKADVPVVRAVLLGTQTRLHIQLFTRDTQASGRCMSADAAPPEQELRDCDCVMSAHFISNSSRVKGKRYSAFGEPVLLFAADEWVLNWHSMPDLVIPPCWHASPHDFFDTEDIEHQLVIAITATKAEAPPHAAVPSQQAVDHVLLS